MNKKLPVFILSIALLLNLAVFLEPVRASHACNGPELKLAGENDFSLSIRGSLGYLDGEARELVYDFESGYRRKTSELIWDLEGLGMIGGVASLTYRNWLNFNLGIWTAITEGSGRMVDYDWFLDVPGAPSPYDWTDRSISDVDVESAIMFDINVSAEIFKIRNAAFHVIAGFKQDSWEWSDSGKEYIYSYESFRDKAGPFNGESLIDYEQVFSIPYLGISVNGSIGKRFECSAYFLFSAAVSAEDKDHHIFTDTRFKETFDGGDYIALGMNATYHVSDAIFVSASLDYQEIPEIDGDMKITIPYEGTFSASDTAGISHKSTMFSLAVGYNF